MAKPGDLVKCFCFHCKEAVEGVWQRGERGEVQGILCPLCGKEARELNEVPLYLLARIEALERKLQPPPSQPFGELIGLSLDKFGCEFCAGVGYEDYPKCEKPCRIPGHAARHRNNVAKVFDALREIGECYGEGDKE